MLDDTQNAAIGETVAELIKDLGQEQSKLLFPVSYSLSLPPCLIVSSVETGPTFSNQAYGEDFPGVFHLAR